jgi:hypothetical protein
MARLRDLARLVRSKNAGPFVLTFDILFEHEASYRLVRDSGLLSPQLFARLYAVPERVVRIYAVDAALALKVTIPRPVRQGDIGDTDSHGGQQYGPLVDLEFPDPEPVGPPRAVGKDRLTPSGRP